MPYRYVPWQAGLHPHPLPTLRGRLIASPSRTTVDLDDGTKWAGPASAEDALNTAKEYRLTAQRHAEVRNASDYDIDRAGRTAQMYAILSIAESPVELTRAVREINERGRDGAPPL